ncbi:ABC transporter ATP-binding protein [Planctomycetaceae bacterium SH139]
MISISNVTVAAGSFSLSQLSFQVERGEYAVLMGKTGVGKTTILESICGLRKVREGRISIDNIEITKWPPADRNIGYVPQDLALFPNLSVRQNLEFAMKLRKQSSKSINDRVEEFANLLEIKHLLTRSTKGLSGGESQRVALGRALAFGPAVLLLDEPLSALDAATRKSAQVMLREINRRTKVTVLHVTHDPMEAEALADRQIRLATESGKAVLDITIAANSSQFLGKPTEKGA